jgi:hypothetical protein
MDIKDAELVDGLDVCVMLLDQVVLDSRNGHILVLLCEHDQVIGQTFTALFRIIQNCVCCKF